MLVEAFVAHPPLESFGEGVLHRLARRDAASVALSRLREAEDRRGSELGAVVADDRAGLPRRATRAVISRTTRLPVIKVSGVAAKHPLVISSMRVSTLKRRPFATGRA